MTNLNKPQSEMRQVYPSIPDAMERATQRNDEVITVIGYHPDSDVGGGNFVYDANRAKADHNGGTVIDPDKTFPSDWNNSTQVKAWLTGDGVGSGVWVRKYDGAINANWFGNVQESIQQAINISAAYKLPLDIIDVNMTVTQGLTFTPVSGTPYTHAFNIPSNSKIKGVNCTFTTLDTVGAIINISPSSTNVKISGINFIGAGVNTNTLSSYSMCIANSIDSTKTARDMSWIEIDHCSFNGFNIDIILTGANNVDTHHNVHTGTIFSRASTSAAGLGYQCFIASCSKVSHHDNLHTSGGFDRHGLYIATAEAGISSYISSFNNVFDWFNTDYLENPFMAAINIRPSNDVSIFNNKINAPHGGGITSITDNGNAVKRLRIHDNTITNITTNSPVSVPNELGAGISLNSINGPYEDCIIANNIITTVASSDGVPIVGIAVSGNGVNITGNSISLGAANQYGIGLQRTCTSISCSGNLLDGNGVGINAVVILDDAALSAISIGENAIIGFTGGEIGDNGGAYTSIGSIVDKSFSYKLVVDGAGGFTISDPTGVVSSVELLASGPKILFKPFFNTLDHTYTMQSATSNIHSFFLPIGTANNHLIVPRDLAGSNLSALTNAYTIKAQYTK